MSKTNRKIVVVSGKGGSAKSTVATQLCATLQLADNGKAKLVEFDDLNKDCLNFHKSVIDCSVREVGNGDLIADDIRELLTSDEELVIDVGGNITTTLFINSLASTRMYRRVDLYVIPLSGGKQDVINAKAILEEILSFDVDAKILFVLSRVRNPKRIMFQYENFFSEIDTDKHTYLLLAESDAIDLSRKSNKTIYELVTDVKALDAVNGAFDKAVDENDKNLMKTYSIILEVMDESKNFYKDYILEGHKVMRELLDDDIKNK